MFSWCFLCAFFASAVVDFGGKLLFEIKISFISVFSVIFLRGLGDSLFLNVFVNVVSLGVLCARVVDSPRRMVRKFFGKKFFIKLCAL